MTNMHLLQIFRHVIIVVLVLIAIAQQATAEGRHFVLGVSASLSASERQEAWVATLEFVSLQMQPGDRLAVYDASALLPVAELEIPDDPLFAKPNPRLARLARPLSELKGFFAREQNQETQFAGTLMAPQFLELAGRQLRPSLDKPLIVILLGAPYYHDKELAFDFGPEGTFPSDGFLRLPAAESPFSTLEKTQLLAGVTIHWAWLREDRWANDAHRQGVIRFWHLLARSEGGTLVSAGASPKAVFGRAAQGIATPLIDAAINPHAKAEMIMLRRRRVDQSEASASNPTASAASMVTETAPDWMNPKLQVQPPGPAKPRGHVKVGLRWGDSDPGARNIDLDLYVKSKPNVKEIFYRVARTPEGWLWKDWVESPAVAHGFETVELNGETDLRQLAVAINFYAGHHPAGGVNAIVRIWVDGEIYETPIRLGVADGNRGNASERRQSDIHWVVIDLPRLVGL
jgi:hypothetical protein